MQKESSWQAGDQMIGPKKADSTPSVRILLLEDDAEFNQAIRDYLGVYLYNVVAVKNGVEGVHAVMRSDFDLIICDMTRMKKHPPAPHTPASRTRRRCGRRLLSRSRSS
jgi:DNA-binding NarL/FixJ family response regulator